MSNPISLILTDHSGNTLQVTGATVLTPAQRQALGIMLSQPLSAVLCDVNGNPLQLTSSGGSGSWASLTGDLTETQVIPFDGGTVGTPDSGISRIGSASLSIGNGTTANTSGSLTLSSLYASLVDSVAVTLTGVFTDGVGSVGTNGQVLSSTVTGTKWINAAASGVTSITGDGTILSNSGSTGAVTLTLANAGQNTVLAGPISGSGAPTYRAIQAADLPSVTSSTFSGFWGGLGLGNIFGVGTPSSSTGFTANTAYVWLFYVSEPVALTKVTINVTTDATSTAASVGIYSTGGTKLIDSGVFTTTAGGTGTGAVTNFINGGSAGSPVSVTLTPGWYYYCFTTNSASNGFEYFSLATATNVAAILNKNGGRVGTAAATTSGLLNTSLGTVTATFIATNADIPAAWFE